MARRSLNSWLLASTLLAVIAAPVLAQQTRNAAPVNSLKDFKPVTAEMLLKPDPADWLMWRRTYDGWGYSPLDQINESNIKNLQVAWSWSLTPGATETTPLVHNGVL
jgi:alcohol dehydrogenase (cytochrome c)